MFNKIIIYKNNLINNVKQVKRENPNSKVCAMVKANAYGVGMNEVVQILENYVDFWGVACFFEATKIKNLTKRKILIVGPLEKKHIDDEFSYSCGSVEDIIYLAGLNKKINIHLKINTGMNRYGFKSIKKFKKALNLISRSKLFVEGVYTHFATSDEFVEKQMNIFNKFVRLVKKEGFTPIVHADNSFVNEMFNHNLDMVRIGFSLFARQGGGFLSAHEIKSEIVEVQTVKKGELVGYDYRFIAQKNMTVGIVPIGYADGFDRKYIGLELIQNGNKCEVLNVCMDCFMLDITNSGLKKGDEVSIVNKFNSLKLYSNHIETNEYEVITKFSYLRAERKVY